MNTLEEDLDAYSNLIFVVLGVGMLFTILIASARHYPNVCEDYIVFTMPNCSHIGCGSITTTAKPYSRLWT
jgi:hypothetical protein